MVLASVALILNGFAVGTFTPQLPTATGYYGTRPGEVFTAALKRRINEHSDKNA